MDYQGLALGVALIVQAAGREGTVTGTLTLNGESTPLTHVYASAEPGFFDKKVEDIHVLLSDVPLSDDARTDTFKMIHLARDGKARIVEVVINAEGTPISGSIFSKHFEGMVSVSGMHTFTRGKMDRTVIEGRLAVETPHEFMGVKFQYDAKFSAPIPRAPGAEELAAALKSPAGLGAAAYIAAVRRGNLANFLTTLTEAAAADYKGSDGAAKLRELTADMPNDTRATTLTPQTDGSVIVELEDHRPADRMTMGFTVRMVQENGVWKVGK